MNKQKLIADQERTIKECKSVLAILENLPDEIPGHGNTDESIHWYVQSWNDFRKVRKMFKGWRLRYKPGTIEKDGRKLFIYERDNLILYLNFDPPCNEGDMCRRVQTGVVEVPTYEIVCN